MPKPFRRTIMSLTTLILLMIILPAT
ncbi:MAG: hypothetical protein LBU32_26205 [Clostridiales bacterium]|nr:hypothetical protein [Clostridiales bacterium]